jgi:hypothetical protein
MRGRWASAAIGAGIARRRMGNEMDQQSQMYEQQQQESQRQIEAQQREIERLRQQQQQQQHAQPHHEDPTQKLLKYADLKQKGIISEEEFQKLKASLLSQI